MVDIGVDTISFRPPMGWWWTALIVACAAAGLCWSVVNERRVLGRLGLVWVTGLRVMVLAGLTGVLAGPGVWVDVDQSTWRVPVVLLADSSASMGLCDVAGATRWQALAKRWLDQEFLGSLRSAGGAVQVYGFDKDLISLESADVSKLTPDGRETDIHGALDRVTRDGRAGVVLLVSDGRDTRRTASGSRLEQLVRKGWRVATVTVGVESSVPDMALSAWSDADSVMRGQSTTIHAVVSHRGLAGRRALVRVRYRGEVIDEKPIELGDTGLENITFDVTPVAGVGSGPWVNGYQLTVETDGEQVEAYVDNNKRWVFVRASGEMIRVLVVAGRPYWDSKFLARTLSEDDQVWLHTVYGVGDQRVIEVVHGGHLSTETEKGWDHDLSRFDVVVLGRGCERFFDVDDAHRLVEFVRDRGGSLVLLGGRSFGEKSDQARVLNKIEPIRWGQGEAESLRLWATREGLTNPVTDFDRYGGSEIVLTRLPGMLAATRVAGERATSIVLLRQGTDIDQNNTTLSMPGVVYQRVGAGKVFAVLGDGMWRWAMLPGEERGLDGVYGAFWTRAVRWLAVGDEFLPGNDYGLSVEHVGIEVDQSVAVRAVARGVDPGGLRWRVLWRQPEEGESAVGLHLASEQSVVGHARIRPQQTGVHELVLQTQEDHGEWLARTRTRFAVYDRSTEMLDTSADPSLPRSISEATGGLVLGMDETDRFVEFVQGLAVARKVSPQWEYRFDRPWVLGLLWVLLIAQWTTGRRGGLV